MRRDLYEELYDLESTHFWHCSKRAWVLDALRGVSAPGDRSLELGCGAGLLLETMTGMGWDAWGTDAAQDALDCCARRGLQQLFIQDATQPLADDRGRFDVVLALDIIEHLDDDRACLGHVRDALNDGGHVIIHVPAYPRLYSYWDEMLGHHRRYTHRGLDQLLEDSGFAVDRITPTFSWLLPPAAVFRFLRRGSNPDDASSDFKYSAGPVNTVGRLLGDLERRVARRRALPFGLSLLATARKA